MKIIACSFNDLYIRERSRVLVEMSLVELNQLAPTNSKHTPSDLIGREFSIQTQYDKLLKIKTLQDQINSIAFTLHTAAACLETAKPTLDSVKSQLK